MCILLLSAVAACIIKIDIFASQESRKRYVSIILKISKFCTYNFLIMYVCLIKILLYIISNAFL